jgi:hypothetical protein
MTDRKIIPLACLGIDRLLLSEVARTLWCDVYWTDEREGEYGQTHGALHVRELTERPETPDVPNLDDALFKLFHAVGRIEQAWGKSFYQVACDMVCSGHPSDLDSLANLADKCDLDNPHGPFRQRLEMLVYRTMMACIGHGIGPDDDGDFPDELDAAPIDMENPLQDQA